MKKCKTCGRELPLESFKKNYLAADGRVSVCVDCISRTRKKHQDEIITPPLIDKSNCNQALAQFTPRELIEELRARGYKGKLQITREVII